MLDDLQSKYDDEFETERKHLGSDNSLKIGSSSDDWVIVLKQGSDFYKIMYKEDGYRGSPEKSTTASGDEVESEVQRFVDFL